MTALTSRYQVVAQLARGGMAEILLARRLGPANFEKLVVLKRPLQVAFGSRAIAEALVDEARLLARINHMNVCQVHDLEEADGQFYLALEYLEGLSLWALLASAERAQLPMDPRAVCGIIAQACDGLDAIHGLRGPDGKLAGVVHRDVSPSNLFLIDSGTVKILDLGIAKAADSEDRTPFGRVKGKLPYIAPEQARGRVVDARADLFALGLVLYDLARTMRPGDRIGAIACESLTFDDMPPAIVDVVRIATAVDPDARFATAKEMGHAVRRAGAALGGWFDRGELARWLAERFADDVAARQQWLAGTAVVDDADTKTQILTLRSALVGDEPMLPAPYTRETEQLDVRSSYVRRAPQRRIVPIVGGVAAATVAIVIAILVATTKRGDPEPAPASPPSAPTAPVDMAPVPIPTTMRVAPNQLAAAPTSPAVTAHDTAAPAKAAVRAVQDKARERARIVEPGQISIDSTPWATVRLDGNTLSTPVYHVSLAAGRHRLHAVTEDGRAQDVVVVIEPGHERRLQLDWRGR